MEHLSDFHFSAWCDRTPPLARVCLSPQSLMFASLRMNNNNVTIIQQSQAGETFIMPDRKSRECVLHAECRTPKGSLRKPPFGLQMTGYGTMKLLSLRETPDIPLSITVDWASGDSETSAQRYSSNACHGDVGQEAHGLLSSEAFSSLCPQRV